MKIETVYSEDGECLGDEYINISTLQQDTKAAITQMIYLDEIVNVMNDAFNKAEV